MRAPTHNLSDLTRLRERRATRASQRSRPNERGRGVGVALRRQSGAICLIAKLADPDARTGARQPLAVCKRMEWQCAAR